MYSSRSKSCAAALLALLVFSAPLSGCNSTSPDGAPKAETGAALGAVAGGLIASQIPNAGLVGTLAGATAGAAVGGMIGAALDEQDRQEMARLTQLSFETGQKQEYTSPRTGAHVRVKIVKETRAAKKLCRTAAQDVALSDGKKSTETVTACKGASGWVV